MRRDSAWRREVRRLTGVLRDADRDPLLAAVERVEAGKAAAADDLHRWERWRERLVAEGRGAVDALVAAYPQADAARFTRLVEEARAAGGAGPAFRELFRRLRALDE
jgi:ribosome-associated protein